VEKTAQISTRVIKDLYYRLGDDKLKELWNSFLTMKNYDSVSNQMLLMEKYEEILGIQSNESNLPISLVTINQGTDVYHDSVLEKTLTKIMKSKLCELTGLSITELLELPTYYLQVVFKAASKIAQDNKEQDKLIKQLTNSLNKKS